MMAPGLLSAGGSLPPNLPQDQIVAIHAEGKQHACGIGKLVASSEEIRKAGKGVAVEVICWIGSVVSTPPESANEPATTSGRLIRFDDSSKSTIDHVAHCNCQLKLKLSMHRAQAHATTSRVVNG